MPSTFLLWGEELMITNNDSKASTSTQNESDESNIENPNRGRIRENISCFLA